MNLTLFFVFQAPENSNILLRWFEIASIQPDDNAGPKVKRKKLSNRRKKRIPIKRHTLNRAMR